LAALDSPSIHPLQGNWKDEKETFNDALQQLSIFIKEHDGKYQISSQLVQLKKN
jgi:hypothetical protein